MPTIRDIYNVLFDFAPAYMKMDWDNVGLVCGKFDTEVHRILVALDPMMDVFEEAKARSCELVVTHHPLIFQSLKQVNDESFDGRNLLYLIENGIASLNLHTNLDCCPGGVNDVLASRLGLADIEILNPVGTALRPCAHRRGSRAAPCRVCSLCQAGAVLPGRPIFRCGKACAQGRRRRRKLRQRDRRRDCCGLRYVRNGRPQVQSL